MKNDSPGVRRVPRPRQRARTALLVCLSAGLACGPGARQFYVERSLPLPQPAPGQTQALRSEKKALAPARVRDRFFLLETRGPDRAPNAAAIERALGGDWGGAGSLWSGLLNARADCRIRSNLALARYLDRRPLQAFDTVRRALGECPADEAIRWNFRALSRPAASPESTYRVLP